MAKSEAQASVGSPAQMRLERRDYYVGVTHRLLVLVLVLGGALVVSLGTNFYYATRAPVIQNFAMTSDLRVQKLAPLGEPLVTEQGLRNWVADALRDIYSYDFVHWRDQLNSNRVLFTSNESFNSFVKAMDASGSLEAVRKNKLVVSSILQEPPNIVKQGIANGRVSWRLEVPLTVRYESASSSMTQQLLVRLVVQRVEQTENPRGLGITQIIAPRT